MAVEVELPRRLFTVEEYHRMAEAGIFGAEERVELIEGEIIQMAPIGPRHVGCVINATRLFITRLGDRAVISPQNPVVIRPRSEPQPDLLLLRARAVSYSRELPTSEDVLLAVEVADTTVRFDRLVKARLYARAGIAEFWLFLATDGAVEVYREPGADGYASVTRHGPGHTVSPLAFPDVGFTVTDFFA
jgi:Uma2 family endonuclease